MSAIAVDLELHVDGEGAWPDLIHKSILTTTNEVSLACLDHETAQGNPSVAIRMELTTGEVVIGEITMRSLFAALKAIEARYGSKLL